MSTHKARKGMTPLEEKCSFRVWFFRGLQGPEQDPSPPGWTRVFNRLFLLPVLIGSGVWLTAGQGPVALAKDLMLPLLGALLAIVITQVSEAKQTLTLTELKGMAKTYPGGFPAILNEFHLSAVVVGIAVLGSIIGAVAVKIPSPAWMNFALLTVAGRNVSLSDLGAIAYYVLVVTAIIATYSSMSANRVFAILRADNSDRIEAAPRGEEGP